MKPNKMFTFTFFILLAGFVSGKEKDNTQSTEWLSDCLNKLTSEEISEFSELAHALALRSTRRPSAVQDDVDNALRRRKRDGGYDGGGKCGTFVLFPFLAFLYSATSTSVSVMNTINNSNDNNNNNTNVNMNMNMNMNARKRRRRREDDPTKEADDLEETVYGSPESVPGLSGIFSSDDLSANLREIRRNLGQEIDKFQLPGLPSVGELRGRLGKKFNWPRLTPNGHKTTKETLKTTTGKSDKAATGAAQKSPVSDKKDTASSDIKTVFDAEKESESKDNDPDTVEKKENADSAGKKENTDTLKNRAGSANDEESEEERDLLSGFLPQLSDLLLKQPAGISKLLPTSFKLSENRFAWTPLAELMFPPTPGRSRIQATEVAEILKPAVNNIKDLEKFLKKMVSTPGINGEVLSHLKVEIDRRIKGLTSRGESKGDTNEDPTRSEPAEVEGSDQFKRAIDIGDLQGGLNELRDEKVPEETTGSANSINEKKKVPGEFSLASLIDPTFQETVWNNSLSIPFFKEITEDISKVGELLQNSSLANFKQKDFDHKFRENLENLHLTSRVKNASEEIKKFKLPGLPSIGEILNDSLNMSSKLLSLPSLTSPISVLSEYLGEGSGESSEEEDYIISEKEKTDPVFELIKSRSALLRSEEKKDIVAEEEQKKEEDAVEEIGLDGMESLEELLLYRLKSVFDDGVIKLRYSLDEATKMFMSQDKEDDISFDPTQAMKNLSISILQGIESLPVPVQLEGMFNPQEDVENLERVIRLAPMMVPYIMQDYKDRLAGLVVGTRVSQEQLFEIHSSLIDWHTKIDSVREELPGGGIHHVLGKLQENNLSLLSLLLHLMTEAGENGEVSLTHHHLNVLDRHLLKAEDLFPGLKNFL